MMLQVTVKPHLCDEFKSLIEAHLPQTVRFKGYQNIEVLQEQDASVFILLSQWDDESAFNDYLAWRTQTGVMAKLSALLVIPPEIRKLNTAVNTPNLDS